MTKDELFDKLNTYIQDKKFEDKAKISQKKETIFNDLYKILHLNDPTKENVKISIRALKQFLLKENVTNSKQGGSGGPVEISETEVYIGVLFVLFGILVTIADTLGYLKSPRRQITAHNTADEYGNTIQSPLLSSLYNCGRVSTVNNIADVSPLSDNSTGGQKYRKTSNKRTVSNKRTTAKRTHI